MLCNRYVNGLIFALTCAFVLLSFVVLISITQNDGHKNCRSKSFYFSRNTGLDKIDRADSSERRNQYHFSNMLKLLFKQFVIFRIPC
jgi:hypothetical protein